jgi:hypothetical protein
MYHLRQVNFRNKQVRANVDGDAAQSWQLEIIGGAILTSPDGEETCFPVREVWNTRDGRTIRYVLFEDGNPRPVVCVHGPSDLGRLPTTAEVAFAAFTANAQ